MIEKYRINGNFHTMKMVETDIKKAGTPKIYLLLKIPVILTNDLIIIFQRQVHRLMN